MKLQQTSFLNNFPIREWYIDCYSTHTYTSTKSPYRGSILSESVHNHTLPQKCPGKLFQQFIHNDSKLLQCPVSKIQTPRVGSPQIESINAQHYSAQSLTKPFSGKKKKKKIKQSDKMLTPWSNLFLGAIKHGHDALTPADI